MQNDWQNDLQIVLQEAAGRRVNGGLLAVCCLLPAACGLPAGRRCGGYAAGSEKAGLYESEKIHSETF